MLYELWAGVREYLRGHIEFAKIDHAAGKGRHVLWLILGRHWTVAAGVYGFIGWWVSVVESDGSGTIDVGSRESRTALRHITVESIFDG